MPEISQDAFEILNPGAVPITSSVLRSRSNSVGLQPSVNISSIPTPSSSTATTPTTTARLSSTPLPSDSFISEENPLLVQRLRDRTVTVSEYDMDESIINGLSGLDGSHRYKRELDHR